MVSVKRAIALLLMTILIMTNATIAYAGEADGTDIQVESREGKEETLEKKKEEEPVAETNQVNDGTVTTDEATTGDTSNTLVLKQETSELTAIGESLDTPIIGEDQIFDSKLLENQPVKETPKEEVAATAIDVYFYVRGNGIDFDIPKEPASYSSSLYSAPIRVEDSIMQSNLSFSSAEEDGSEDSLLSDGFTASNGVTDIISRLPSAEDIHNIVPDFDPETHYVVWYVVKKVNTDGSDQDVRVHVDGVIRQRRNIEQPKEEEITKPVIDPEHAQKLDELESRIEFHIVPKLLDENGRQLSEIEYDRQPHMVGGFDIVVTDTMDEDDPKKLAEYIFNCLGKLVAVKVYAGDEKTVFEYAGETFYLNITSAYTYVTDELDDIHFYRGSEEVSWNDITVTDVRGISLANKVTIDPIAVLQASDGYDPFSLRKDKIKITIKAGTTVKNDDGTTITNASFKLTKGSLKEGHSIQSVTIVGSQTGVGQSPNEITNVVIVDANGEEVTDYYNIDLEKGKLQLVDANKKGSDENGSSQYTQTSSADDTGLRFSPDTSGTARKNSTEILNSRVARAKITHADGSVTYINVPFETSHGNDLSDNQPKVLGARRASTGDGSDTIYRIMIILVSLVVLIQLIRKNNTSAEMS